MDVALIRRRWLAPLLLLALLLAIVGPVGVASAAEPDAVELTTACEGTDSAGFTDTEGTTFEFEIDCFAHRGFTKGTGTGSTYEPFGSNTRWQMATFIYRVLEAFAEEHEEFDVPEPSDQGFDDIGSLKQEFQDAINVLTELGVVEGLTPNRYDPYSTVRRDQMASFINRATGAVAEAFDADPNGFTTEEEFFPDIDGNIHEDNINGIASEGIVQGRTDGRYHPRDEVLRGQMAAFIMRWVQVLEFEVENNRCDTALVDVDVVDTNFNGELDFGDLIGLDFDGDPEQFAEDGVDDTVRLEDDDGSVVEIETGDGNSVLDDDGLEGDLVGDDGAVVVAIGDDDNVLEVSEGDVDGLDLNGHVLSFGDGFTVAGCDDPVTIEDGGIDVLDLSLLEDDELQGIVDQINDLFGDVLGDAGDDVLNVDDLLNGDLGNLFDDLLGGLLDDVG